VEADAPRMKADSGCACDCAGETECSSDAGLLGWATDGNMIWLVVTRVRGELQDAANPIKRQWTTHEDCEGLDKSMEGLMPRKVNEMLNVLSRTVVTVGLMTAVAMPVFAQEQLAPESAAGDVQEAKQGDDKGKVEQKESAKSKEPVKTEFRGFKVLSKQDGPFHFEFEDSQLMTERLAEHAKAAGYETVNDASLAKTRVKVSGEIRLLGGPKFYRGMKVTLGKASQAALQASDGKRDNMAGEYVGAGVLSIGTALANSTLALGVGLSNLGVLLADMSGFRPWFNGLLAGDPRGWCLSRCHQWNFVEQTASVKVTWETAGGESDKAKGEASTFTEPLVVDDLVVTVMDPVFKMFVPVEAQAQAEVKTAQVTAN